MTFDNLCKIVDGEYRNIPSITAYEKIETKPHLIKRGDLFVANEQEAINQAIENGAYGILHEGEATIIDEEVAWIEVTSIHEALIKLLRFSLLKSDSLFYYFLDVEYDILKQILQKEHVIFLNSDVKKNFHKILKANNDTLFICNDQSFLHSIYPEFITYHDKSQSLIKLTQQTLFLSSFTYDDIHYEAIKLPSLFLPSLNRALHFAQESNLCFDIEKLAFIETFHPLFISNQLTIRPFGDSEHVFILIKNKDEIDPALEYIEKMASWANILLFIPQGENENVAVTTRQYEQLIEVNDIDVNKFNFILILANYNELFTILQNNKKEQYISLF